MDLFSQYKVNGRVSPEDFRGAKEEVLLELKSLIDADILHISGQLLAAMAEHTISGVYADADWFRRATMAKRIKGQLSQRIQNELSRQRRESFRANHQGELETRIRSVIAALHIVLTPEQKNAVLLKARELQHEERSQTDDINL